MATLPARWSLRLSYTGKAPYRPALTSSHSIRVPAQRRWVHKPASQLPRRRQPPRNREWAASPAPAVNQINVPQSYQPQQPADHGSNSQPSTADQAQPGPNQRLATALAESNSSDLVSEVHIPKDPHGVLPSEHPALSLLGNSSLVIQRQIEFMNIMLGFEQANRYIIMDGQGQTLGYIAERDHGIGSAMARQMFKTHRSFTTHIFDSQEREVLRIHRPFAWISSRIRIYDPVPEGGYSEMETSAALQNTSASAAIGQGVVAQVSPLKLEEMRIIGEAQQQWAPLRRKYNLFTYRPLEPAPEVDNQLKIDSGDQLSDTTALTEARIPEKAIEAGMSQFAHVNEPFLSWDFHLRDEKQNDVGSVNRNFSGFAREIFTDTGVYALRMDSAAQSSALLNQEGHEIEKYERDATAMTLDQRAVMLATAVSIDFDYFSRHSGAGHGGFMPLWFPMGGGTAAEGAAGAGAAGAAGAGAAEAGAVGAVGAASRGVGGAVGAGEGAIAGAGTMAGYEAMQRGVYGPRGGVDDASPQSQEPVFDPDNQQPTEQSSGESPQESNWWGDGDDPWKGGGPGDSPPPSAGASGGEGEGGGGLLDAISDFFGD